MGIVLGVEEFDLQVVSEFGKASGHQVVGSGLFRRNLFVGSHRQFGESLIAAMGNPFRIKGVVGLLVEFPASGINPVNNGLVGLKVNCVLTSLIGDARMGISLDLGALGINPRMDPIVKGVRGHGDGFRGHFCGRVSDELYDVIDQEATLANPPFVNVVVNAR
jgi:hypothetical protein